MTTSGDVEMNIIDGGAAVVVPGNEVQVVIGTSSAGTVGQVVASRNINTVVSVFGSGPLVEACALIIAAGGTVLAIKATSTTPGACGAVTTTGGGSSVITATGTPNDSYLVKLLVVTPGTIATAGIRFQISLDAGRTYGPVIALGVSVTYLIPNTGVTLNFAAGTVAAGYTTVACVEPLWGTSGVQVALNALQASSYALVGWGSMHIVGPMSGANAATIQGYLATLKTGKIFTVAMTSARDAITPVAYGGAGESEATWTTAVLADFASLSADRVLVTSGHYNVQSPIPNPAAGAPKYRRPLSWVLASRQVQIPPQRHAGKVADGSLSEIVVDPTNDPADGFVYHDERLNPGFDAARFCAARTRIKKQGWYIANPNLMSGAGSVFTLLPLRNVMDIACGIVTEVGQDVVNEDVRLNKNGTIAENDARTIERVMKQAIADNMIATNEISDATVVVSRDQNVQTTSKVKVSVTIWSRGYVLELDIDIGFGTGQSAA